MIFIKQKSDVFIQDGWDEVSIKKMIEKCARVSYKSEDKITDDSYIKFVDNLIARDHARPLEFGTVYLTIPKFIDSKYNLDSSDRVLFYQNNPYSKVCIKDYDAYITTNYRVIVEYKNFDDLKYLTPPTKYHEQRYYIKFITNQAVMNEYRTHITLSHLAESSRYCNYGRDKFANQITYIIPGCNYLNKLEEGEYHYDDIDGMCKGPNGVSLMDPRTKLWQIAEWAYLDLIKIGYTAQEAALVLTKNTKSELISCGFKNAWDNFFYRRCDVSAHPMARQLAIETKKKFNNIIEKNI